MLIHPGEISKQEFLDQHGLNANRLATKLGIAANAITTIVNGERSVTARMSKALAHAFGMSEAFFLTLQVRYDPDLATVEMEADGKDADRLRRADELARELRIAT